MASSEKKIPEYVEASYCFEHYYMILHLARKKLMDLFCVESLVRATNAYQNALHYDLRIIGDFRVAFRLCFKASPGATRCPI